MCESQKIAQRVNVLAAKSDGLSWISGPLCGRRKLTYTSCSLDCYMCFMVCASQIIVIVIHLRVKKHSIF